MVKWVGIFKNLVKWVGIFTHFNKNLKKQANGVLSLQKIETMQHFTITQYETLKTAIVDAAITGIRTVTYGDKTVTYMSLDEMRKVLAMMEEDLFPERFGRRRKIAVVNRGYFNRRRNTV